MTRVKVKIRGHWQNGVIDDPPVVSVVLARAARLHRKANDMEYAAFPHGEWVRVLRTDRGFKVWVPWSKVDCRPDRKTRKGGRRK